MTVSKGKKPSSLMIHAFRPTTTISKKAQRSSCSDLDSEVTVLVPRQTEVSMSVRGKPSELGISLLLTNQRTFIYTGPQALSWRPSTIRSQVGPGSRLQVPVLHDRKVKLFLERKRSRETPLFLKTKRMFYQALFLTVLDPWWR